MPQPPALARCCDRTRDQTCARGATSRRGYPRPDRGSRSFCGSVKDYVKALPCAGRQIVGKGARGGCANLDQHHHAHCAMRSAFDAVKAALWRAERPAVARCHNPKRGRVDHPSLFVRLPSGSLSARDWQPANDDCAATCLRTSPDSESGISWHCRRDRAAAWRARGR